jgi:predicted DsbA family dithiol-disulfide isomerase
MTIDIVEYTDPGCVWSWGSEPKLRALKQRHGDRLRWRRVFGVQVARADRWRTAAEIRDGWLEVSAHTQAPAPAVLWWVADSSRPASLAAKAAELQGTAIAERVLRRLREATFVTGRPADTPGRIIDAIDGVPGLDIERLLDDALSGEVDLALREDWEETRRPLAAVVALSGPEPHPGAAKEDGLHLRYAFPTIVVRGPAGERVVPGWRPLAEYEDALRAVDPDFAPTAPEPLDPAAALDHYRSLTAVEFDVLTGDADPPATAVRVETATVPIWLAADEAAARNVDTRAELSSPGAIR